MLEGEAAPADEQRARFCVVTKGPHLRNEQALACLMARLTAFGVHVRLLRRIVGTGDAIVQALYPLAVRYFDHRPTTPAQWDLLAHRFDTAEFKKIFGRRYDPDLVIPASTAIRENRLTAGDLTAIWETGRDPIHRATLVARYGATVAPFVLQGADSYGWFRGPLPLGISRIASSMTAFALRHERLYGGEPVILMNGHVPALAHLFAPAAWVLDLGIARHGAQIDAVRSAIAGADGRPERCLAGSIRRDAIDGRLPLASPDPVTSRNNLLHCSDGLLIGAIETRALVPEQADRGDLLTEELDRAGLTRAEIERIVLQDPRVRPRHPDGHLSDVTRGVDLDRCVAEILTAVPPIFGVENGYADGLEFDVFDRAISAALTATTTVVGAARPEPAPVTVPVRHTGRDAELGRRAIADGTVAALVPAGGTGGRFGGYGVPEADPARQKALRRAFLVSERQCSSLDIRLANLRYWADGERDRLPVAVMASPTSETALRQWRDRLDEPFRKSLRIFTQHGVYRIDRSLAADVPRRRWVDAVLRDSAGRPCLKPGGTLNLWSCFILAGLLDAWEQRGIDFLASANGDDAAYRLNPAAIGYLARHPGVDCVLVGIPWGYTATIRRRGRELPIRGDLSGWTMDEAGLPVDEPVPDAARRFDAGGAICHEIGHSGEPCLRIGQPPHPPQTLFNTSQLYVRLSAVRRAIERTGTTDPLGAVRRLVAGQSFAIENKTVVVDGETVDARQIHQPLHGILSWFDRCDVLTTTRRIGPTSWGSYAPLKEPTDQHFVQLLLNQLQAHGDSLVFAD
ncbi:hypothetical protein SAMN05421812_10779 [Asanoa hainanensis]|uniref:Uncharacterized protein n=2 Tax=Asanoa hainanensis TaxID=560556 RepID=A0A239N1E6_9ACTN|nr:hypothetical protein SAMN05421812_10779 [Asanoa hainanensis]